MVTIVTEEHTGEAASGRGDGEDLWLSAADAAATTGWTLKPEGLCRGEVCVPVPRGREAAFVRDGQVNIAAFWRHMGRPAVHPADGSVWVLGSGAAERAEALQSLEARVRIEGVLEVPPVRLTTVPGFETAVFPFTTDIPFLTAWGEPLLYGPGSIQIAHTPDEHISIGELHRAVDGYVQIARKLLER